MNIYRFLEIADNAKENKNVGGRGLKKKAITGRTILSLSESHKNILDEFCKAFKLEKTQTVEALIELLPALKDEFYNNIENGGNE